MIRGLIDIHCQGQGGFGVMSGDPEYLLGLSMRLKAQGVAGFLATFVSSPLQESIRALEMIEVGSKDCGAENGSILRCRDDILREPPTLQQSRS